MTQEKQMDSLGSRLKKIKEENEKFRREIVESKEELETGNIADVNSNIIRKEIPGDELVNCL